MTLQVYKACCGCFLNELGIQLIISGYEGNIHQRTVFLHNSSLEHLALVQEIVQDLCLLLVMLLHCLKAAHILNPLEYQAADIDTIARRCIIQRLCICLRLVLQHGGNKFRKVIADQILTDDHYNHTGRSNVLLYTEVNEAVIGYIYRLGQNVGRHICYQDLALGVGKLVESGSVDRIVMADIYIVCILRDGKIGAIRNVGEGLVLGRSYCICLAVLLCFLVCLLCPLTGDDVISHTVLHQVHGNCCELLRCTALQEQYLVVVRDVHQIPKILLSFLDDVVIYLGTVAHFHNAHAASLVIHHLLSCLL